MGRNNIYPLYLKKNVIKMNSFIDLIMNVTISVLVNSESSYFLPFLGCPCLLVWKQTLKATHKLHASDDVWMKLASMSKITVLRNITAWLDMWLPTARTVHSRHKLFLNYHFQTKEKCIYHISLNVWSSTTYEFRIKSLVQRWYLCLCFI